jgi:hypothetical protein
MNQKRIYLSDDDVLMFENHLSAGNIFTVSQYKGWLGSQCSNGYDADLCQGGQEGNFLQAAEGGGWKKGKIRVCIEVEIEENPEDDRVET